MLCLSRLVRGSVPARDTSKQDTWWSVTRLTCQVGRNDLETDTTPCQHTR